MKIAVLTAGRSGSTSLYHACQHVKNFSSGHDTKEGALAVDRVKIADAHIEIDTRFAWMLGLLSEQNGDDVYYVLLTRKKDAIAMSYNRRWANRKGIIRGYCEAVLQRDKPHEDIEVALDLVQTVEANIRVFLESRPHSVIRLENWSDDLTAFFAQIGAEVDLDAAKEAFAQRHNATKRVSWMVCLRYSLSRRIDALEALLKWRKGL